MNPLYFPAWHTSPAQIITVIFVVAIPVFFALEATALFSFGYSKFANREQQAALPSRLGMFIIYFPAVVIAPAVYAFLGNPGTTWHWLVMVAVSLHFGKRCLETMFLHKYSGVMNVFTALAVCSLYSILAALLGVIAATEIPAELVNSDAFNPWYITGGVLWTVGIAGNFYHHWLLANLRKPGETGYKLPRGGLFQWVACPHYTMELLGWLGFAFVFHHWTAWVLLGVMTAYLAGRGHNTVKWYRDRLGDEVPDGWKRMVPFVY